MNLEIESALNSRVASLGYTTAWPNVSFKPNGQPYLKIHYLSSPSEQVTYGCDRLPQILQVSVFDVDGTGTTNLMPMVEAVINKFPRNTRIPAGAQTVRIDKAPWASGLIQPGNGWASIAITIPFEVYT